MTTKDLGVVTTTAAKSPQKICQTAPPPPASGGAVCFPSIPLPKEEIAKCLINGST